MPYGGRLAKLHEPLAIHGETLLDLTLLRTWGDELNKMNLGKEGARYRIPETLIKLQAFIRAYLLLPYRQLESLTRRLSQWEPRFDTGLLDYLRRVNNLDVDLELV
jgi:hypothetical protein